MRVRIDNEILYIHAEDVPPYKKGGSVVRNNYFWALRSIAVRSVRDREWEYEMEVWYALNRMLLFFMESGYIGLRETQLEFEPDSDIPIELRSASTWQ
ncbi:hypothetical protein IQ266_06875 [filamentous cyanobacterium LEGE 11480]|uniref:Uncharacterized protein n=1 Tax=Romeriopsis navalis LEGE 11480 TaxID=2777977 RepID=A0A928VN02_9CYAN|nr:hypothetical protein [Romeriopsis navalis]MBE9029485.1 hypothetical protein [Romeriopsis navalis LEGE 11480]